jgi:mercuric ion transport protein
MKRSDISAVGSVLTAVIASVCCIGPALLALIGAGSIRAFGAFESYRPYFIVLTVILLGLAFFLTYRKREIACEDGSCKVVKAGKWNKIGVWASAIIALAAILFPYANFTPTVNAASVKPTGAQGQFTTAFLSIKGMDCEACANGLQASLSQMKGVKSAVVRYKTGTAMVEYDPAQIAPTEFVNFLSKAGYKSTVVKTTSPAQAKDSAPVACPGGC